MTTVIVYIYSIVSVVDAHVNVYLSRPGIVFSINVYAGIKL